MRVLGIETSSRRGSVALVEDGLTVRALTHDVPNGHAELLLGLVERVLAEAGWPRATLDRIGVGVGPGSFTGIRVGVALAQGIGLGLDRPVLGVGSLQAMSRAVPATVPGARCAFLDARRNEVFGAEYGPTGVEARSPRPLRREDVPAWLADAGTPLVILGEIAATLEPELDVFRAEATDLPHASGVAAMAAELDPRAAPADALYVRPPDAIRPNLPRSPLSSGPT